MKTLFLVFLTTASAFSSSAAQATALKCQEMYKVLSANRDESLSFASPEISFIVNDIASKFGINPKGIALVECPSIQNAAADFSAGTETVLPGEYILYNPTWLKNVAGSEKTELYAILGHELGHIASRHFIKPNLTRREKELEADRFAGCVVATVGGNWDTLERLLKRLRPEVATEYPSSGEAILVARKGWTDCDSRHLRQEEPPAGLSLGEVLGSEVNRALQDQGDVKIVTLPEVLRSAGAPSTSGQQPDVIGIRMGMPFEDVETLLVKEGFIRTLVKEARLELEFGAPAVRVRSQNYPVNFFYERIRNGNIRDEVHLLIASPLSGSGVFSVRYMSSFPEAVAPLHQLVSDALLRKYGEPNPDDSKCWTWFEGQRVVAARRWSCIGFLEAANMLEKDKIDVVLTAHVNAIDGKVFNTDLSLRDARIEATVQSDFQKYVETIFPAARVLTSTNSDPIKF